MDVAPFVLQEPKLDAGEDEGALGVWLSEATSRVLEDGGREQRARQAWLIALMTAAALIAVIVSYTARP